MISRERIAEVVGDDLLAPLEGEAPRLTAVDGGAAAESAPGIGDADAAASADVAGPDAAASADEPDRAAAPDADRSDAAAS